MDTRKKNKKNPQQQELHDDETEQSSTQASKHADMLEPNQETVGLDLILQELRGFRQDNKEQLDDIKEEIKKTNTRLDTAEERIVKAEERIQNTEDVLTEMLKLQIKLEAKITEQESRSRRDNIRIYGVPEGTENESPSMIAYVEKLLRDNLDIPEDSALQIERAHRALGPKPPEGSSPRSILARFLSFKTKETILRLAWQKRGFICHGKRINLDNDYAPRILQKRREYADIRRVLKDRQIQFQTLYPARLRVKHDDETCTYDTVEEATSDLVRRGFPLEITKPPETLLDQVRQLTWEQRSQRSSRRTQRANRGSNFREKLQAFRRSSTPPAE